jgi:pimeloyl-ACP methyl ester carboxylesterase
MARQPSKPKLLILHGVNGSRTEMGPWAEALEASFDVETVNLCGHGGRRIPDALTMEAYASDLLKQMDDLGLAAPIVLGYSFGGLVALYLAVHHPARVSALITVATQWVYDERAVRHVTHLLQVARLTSLSHRATHLQRIHYPNRWQMLAQRLGDMYSSFRGQPPVRPEELDTIECPCLVLSASADPITSVEETIALHKALRGSEIALMPGVAHPPQSVPAAAIQRAVTTWSGRRLSL